MQLLYVWGENYKDIFVSEEFNFGGPYRMRYDLDKLFVKKSSFFIEDFFKVNRKENMSASNINNITAVIGENGTGKSSLIECLMCLLNNKARKEMLKSKWIIAFYVSPKGKKPLIKVYHSFEIDINIEYSEHIDIEFRQFNLENNFSRLPQIYFSNIFDSKTMNTLDTCIDVSTNNYLNIMFGSNRNNNNMLNLQDYYRFETEEQIRFIIEEDKSNNIVQFKLPEKISISPKMINYDEWEIGGNHPFYIFINSLINDAFYNNKIISLFIERILQHILFESNFYKDKFYYSIINEAVESINTKDVVKALKQLKNRLSKKLLSNHSFLKIVNGSIELLNCIKELEGNIVNNEIEISVNSQLLSKLLGFYYTSTKNDYYLKFSWRSLSSGELAMLSLFSRLYSVKQSIDSQKNSNIILFIDEGESYFHPQWQKQLISHLVDVLPGFYRNKSIQIIMTSNSPFIASDLPKTNVIFLKKAGNGTISLSELEDQHQTFAANINTLLSHSFFMQDGLMGRFAKNKINQVIDTLVNKSAAEIISQRNEIEALISIIGEPLIRNKLTQLLQEKLVFNGMSLEERVTLLEDQLNKLRRETP